MKKKITKVGNEIETENYNKLNEKMFYFLTTFILSN